MLTKQERHVMEHATGWKSRNPLFRNHFVAGPGHDDWETLGQLTRAGLMRLSREPSELSGGDYVYSVTDSGIVELKKGTNP